MGFIQQKNAIEQIYLNKNVCTSPQQYELEEKKNIQNAVGL